MREAEAGISITSIKASALRAEADRYIAAHPEVIAWAQDAVSKLLNGAPKQAR